jgi:hypothetical protein
MQAAIKMTMMRRRYFIPLVFITFPIIWGKKSYFDSDVESQHNPNYLILATQKDLKNCFTFTLASVIIAPPTGLDPLTMPL